MKNMLVAAAFLVSTTGPVGASEQADAMAPVKQFMQSFNVGDWKATVAACSESTATIDNVPPHSWQGSDACDRWARDLQAFFEANQVVEPRVTLLKPKHVDIAGDRAYVVVPTTIKFKMKGKPSTAAGQFTAALVKGGSGWKMTGWAWADQ